jgi:membrane protein
VSRPARIARAKGAAAMMAGVDLRGLHTRARGPLLPILDLGRRCAARFIELEGIDRAMALAGQAFAALLPLLIVVGAASPDDGRDVAGKLIDKFQLSGSAADALSSALERPPGPENGASIAGGLLLVISALSFTRALQRLYVRAWRLPPLGMRGNLWGLWWLAAFIAWGSFQPLIVGVFDGVAAAVVTEALATLLWLVTPWLLVARRLPWRRLLPQALLTAGGLLAVTSSAALYAPQAVSSAAHDFGVIGVAFTLLSLLFVFAVVLVAAAAIGATLAEGGEEGRE